MNRRLRRLGRLRYGITQGIALARIDAPVPLRLEGSRLFLNLFGGDIADGFRHIFYKTMIREIHKDLDRKLVQR